MRLQPVGGKSQERQRGQNLVEFAVSLALLVIVFLGVFDLGRAYNAYIIITNAAREGAYYGAMYPTDTSGIVARTRAEAEGSGISLPSGNVSVSSTGAKGSPIRVSVYYDFRLLSSVLPGVRTIRLRSRAEMVIF